METVVDKPVGQGDIVHFGLEHCPIGFIDVFSAGGPHTGTVHVERAARRFEVGQLLCDFLFAWHWHGSSFLPWCRLMVYRPRGKTFSVHDEHCSRVSARSLVACSLPTRVRNCSWHCPICSRCAVINACCAVPLARPDRPACAALYSSAICCIRRATSLPMNKISFPC